MFYKTWFINEMIAAISRAIFMNFLLQLLTLEAKNVDIIYESEGPSLEDSWLPVEWLVKVTFRKINFH